MRKLMRARRRDGGFSLVELMVAMVLGIIVSAAVVALVVAVIRANRQTLQATRLNQELRATLAVIAGDLRRARAVEDPLTAALLAGGNPYRAVDTATANCVIYAYEGAADGPWHVVRLDAGRVELHGFANPPDCASEGVEARLGSGQVEVTALTFSPTTTAATPPQAFDENSVREFTVTITGHLVDGDRELSGTSRTMSQTVYVRALGTGS